MDKTQDPSFVIDYWLSNWTELDFKTHIKRQNLHWCVEKFVSWMLYVSTPKEIPER